MADNFWKKLNKPVIALAPMAGVCDSAFRQVCKSQGADLVYTEMVSADALNYDSKKTLGMLKLDKSESPVVCQIFGKRPEMYPKAVQLVEEAGFDGIDINFGCPARKVVAHGGGVTLMKNLPTCHKLIATAIKHTSLPVSVKIRAGIDEINAMDFLEFIRELPISAIMIHGRGFKDAFSAPIAYDMIKKIKENFDGIVIGNGGINSPEEAKYMLEQTGIDGIGLARGLHGRPWLAQQIKDYIATGTYEEFDFEKTKEVALNHLELAYKTKGQRGIVETRKHLAWYVKGFAGAAELRSKLVKSESISEIEKIFSKANLVPESSEV